MSNRHHTIIKNIGLRTGEYAIFGSSVLSVRGIRESDDLDIIVTPAERNRLISIYPDHVTDHDDMEKIYFDTYNTEIFQNRIHAHGQEQAMIDSADTINGLPYVNLDYFVHRKKLMGRPKDKKDLELLAAYQAKQNL